MGWKSFHVGVVAVALTAAGLAALSLGAWFLYEENTSGGLAGLGAGLVLLFAATIDRFESIKGLGMEAKTRELDATIDKAEIALAQLRELTRISAASLVKLHCGIGRLDTAPGVMENEALAQKAKQMLKESGATDLAIREAMVPWLRVTALDVYFALVHEIRKALHSATAVLDRNVPGETADEANKRITRGNTVRAYDNLIIRGGVGWSHEKALIQIERLVNDAPELTATQKAPLQTKVEKGAAELRHMFAKLEFADRHYWETLPVQR